MDSTVNLKMEHISINHKPSVHYYNGRGMKKKVNIPPTRHMTETTNTTAYTKRTFTAKLHSDKTKGLVTRRHERKLSASKDVGWKCGELGCRINTSRKLNHKLFEFERGELAMEIDDRSDTDKLGPWVLSEDEREGVGYQVNSLLLTPTTDENEQLGLYILISV